MKGNVGIAELEAHLSEYVRTAQRGKEIIIKDRDTPIAKLVPVQTPKLPFRVIPASRTAHSIDHFKGFRPAGMTSERVQKLIEDTRGDRLDEWLNLGKSTSTRR
jgi:prevent-host-death family protein